MEIQNLVQASADVVTITRLRKGDVYKRVETSQFSGTKLQVGVVTSVMNNGDDAAVVALEFTDGYGDFKPTQKVFTAGADAALFQAEPVEVQSVMEKVNEAAKREVDRHRKALGEAESNLALVEDVVRHCISAGLAAAQVAATAR